MYRLSLLALFFCAMSSLAFAGSDTKSWAKHCSLAGIALNDRDEQMKKLLSEFAQRCDPTDACLLSCERNQCGAGAGGCFHDCSNGSIYGPPEVLADMFSKRDRRLCPSP